MDTDRNLMFGVLALQTDLIDSHQFVEACTLWASRKENSLAALLLERGWILPGDQDHLEYLLQRKLERCGGECGPALANLRDDVKHSLAALGDAELEHSLAGEPRAGQLQCLETVNWVANPDDRYELTRLYASGGIGRVWLARDRELGREVALKELRPESADDSSLCARFLREARITGQLEHPGIVPVYELARRPDTHQPFYTMRFVKGRTLSDATRAYHDRRLSGEDEPLEFLGLLGAFVTVCNTVAYAHSRGVIHRDLKGQNVVLADFGEVVVLDWGLAKLVGVPIEDSLTFPVSVDRQFSGGVDLTQAGQTLGTPAYMSPEQAASISDQVDIRTDVYGLGAMLYEILTAHPPFYGSDTREVLRKVREEPPILPRELWPDVPLGLEAVCLRALAKRSTDRYDSASELAQDVQNWQEMERRKAEEALRDSEALYHSLVESIPLSVFRKDLEGRFTFGNQRFCNVMGIRLDQLIGKTDFDLCPKALAEKYRRDDRRVIESGEPFEDVEKHYNTVNDWCYVNVIKIPVLDAIGRIVGIQGIFWDITERKQREE
jgi:PAS domain S-box-containing protein